MLKERPIIGCNTLHSEQGGRCFKSAGPEAIPTFTSMNDTNTAMVRTWPCDGERRLASVDQFQSKRHALCACNPKVEPLEVGDVVMLAEGVRPDLQLRVTSAARVSAHQIGRAADPHATHLAASGQV